MKRRQKTGFLLLATLCLVPALFVIGGCGSNSSPDSSATVEPTGAQAKLVLDAKSSVYPFLVISNTGNTTAEDVHVLEAKSGQELTTRMIFDKGTMKPATQKMDIAVKQAAQLQVISKEVRDYLVKWNEAGKSFSKHLVLPDPQKIETH